MKYKEHETETGKDETVNFQNKFSYVCNEHGGGDQKRVMTMSIKLILCLACFTLLASVIIWVIQILMSDTLYENVRIREIDTTIKKLKEQIVSNDSANIFEMIEEYSTMYDICIGLYTAGEDGLDEVYAATVSQNSMVNNASPKALRSMYELALKHGGVYSGRFGFDFFMNPNKEEAEEGTISLIRAEVFRDKAQNEYMLLLNTNVTPVGAAKKTFGAQFSYILLILIFASVIMAYLMSRIISRPLKSMNESAKKLARGKYDVEFSGGGYREIDELSDTLNYAASELARNDHLQKELLANISHDLRTPLTMIKGYGEIMRDIPGENNSENIQVIIDETTRLSELVNDLLDLSKIESGTGKFEAEVFDITAAVNEVICRYDKMRAVKDYDIHFEYTDNINVNADRSMILQVVYNLINNAINYSGDDKYVGVVQHETRDEHNRRFVRISVVDHGQGIESDQLPFIWDRYYKVDNVHRRATVGTGLGLSIVKKVLERHGASYGVESSPGNGSVFWFEMPIWEK